MIYLRGVSRWTGGCTGSATNEVHRWHACVGPRSPWKWFVVGCCENPRCKHVAKHCRNGLDGEGGISLPEGVTTASGRKSRRAAPSAKSAFNEVTRSTDSSHSCRDLPSVTGAFASAWMGSGCVTCWRGCSGRAHIFHSQGCASLVGGRDTVTLRGTANIRRWSSAHLPPFNALLLQEVATGPTTPIESRPPPFLCPAI